MAAAAAPEVTRAHGIPCLPGFVSRTARRQQRLHRATSPASKKLVTAVPDVDNMPSRFPQNAGHTAWRKSHTLNPAPKMNTLSRITVVLCTAGALSAQTITPPARPEIRPAVPVSPVAPVKKKLVARSIKLPVIFEENKGQAPAPVRFSVAKPDHSIWFVDGAAVFGLSDGRAGQPRDEISRSGDKVTLRPVDRRKGAAPGKGAIITMSFAGGDKVTPKTEKEMKTKGEFLGRKVQLFGTASSIVYSGIYPGVDARFYDAGGRVRYDLTVAPGKSTSAIRLKFDGTTGLSIDGRGNLVVSTGTGIIRHSAPQVFAEAAGNRRTVKGSFVLLSANEASFRISSVRPDEKIIIDPEITYSTYLGGSGYEASENVSASGARSDVVVSTYSPDFPVGVTTGATSSSSRLLRFDCSDPANPQLVTVVGTGGYLTDCRTAPDGAAYVALETSGGSSGNFQVPSDAFDPSLHPGLVLRIEADGSVARATYFPIVVRSLAIDMSGVDPGVFVAGDTELATPPQPIQGTSLRPHAGGADGFVARLSPTLDRLVWFTYLGGSGSDVISDISVRGGQAAVVGDSSSTDYPVAAGSVQLPATPPAPSQVIQRLFVTKLDASGHIASSSVFGEPVTYNVAGGIVSNTDGGTSFSAWYGLVPVGIGSFSGSNSARVFKLNAAGTAIVREIHPSPALGFFTVDNLAADENGGVWVAGDSGHSGYATAGAVQTGVAGIIDGALARYSSAGDVEYLTYLGGSDYDLMDRVARSGGLTHCLGYTMSPDFPVTSSALQGTHMGSYDVFYTIIREAPVAFTVTKTASPSTINVNGQTTCTITVTNNGDRAGTFSVKDAPETTGLVLLATPPWQSTGNGSATSGIQTLAPGASAIFTINVAGIAPGVFSNTAQVMLTDGTLAASASTSITVNPIPLPPRLLVTVDDDVYQSSPEASPFHITVTVENLGDSPVTDVSLRHEITQGSFAFANIIGAPPVAITDPNTGLGIVDPTGNPIVNPATGRPIVIRSYSTHLDQIDPGPASAARIFVTTNTGLKTGEVRTLATATVDDFPDQQFQATGVTTIGNPVAADMVVDARLPRAGDNPAPAGYQQVFIDVSRVPANASPALPSFQLNAEIRVPQGARFPHDTDLTPETTDDTNPSIEDTDNDGIPGSRLLFMLGAEGQKFTRLMKVFGDTNPNEDTWIATFNVRNPAALPDTARILLPADVRWRSVRAFIAPGPIIDANGMEETLTNPNP